MTNEQLQTVVETEKSLLVDAGQTAALLGISRAGFYGLLSSGRIGPEPVRLGKRVLWKRAEIEAWCAADCPARERWQAIKEAEKIMV